MRDDDCFDRIGVDLARLTRQGAHLTGPDRARRRRRRRLRRALAGGLTVVALAVSLVSEFPATARAQAPPTGQTTHTAGSVS